MRTVFHLITTIERGGAENQLLILVCLEIEQMITKVEHLVLGKSLNQVLLFEHSNTLMVRPTNGKMEKR